MSIHLDLSAILERSLSAQRVSSASNKPSPEQSRRGRKLRTLATDAASEKERYQLRAHKAWLERSRRLPWKIADQLAEAGYDVNRRTEITDCPDEVYLLFRLLHAWTPRDRDRVLLDVLNHVTGKKGKRRVNALRERAIEKWGATPPAMDPSVRHYPFRDPQTGEKLPEDTCDDYGVPLDLVMGGSRAQNVVDKALASVAAMEREDASKAQSKKRTKKSATKKGSKKATKKAKR